VTVGQGGQPLVDIILEDAGPRPVGVHRMIDRWTKLNVKQAKKLVDSAPQPIITRVPQTQAEAIKLELEALGARLSLRPADPSGSSPTDLV
jgi:large subunit ribosomal protein L7/L12